MIRLGFRPQGWDIHAFGRANQANFVSEDGRTAALTSRAVVQTLEFLDDVVQSMGGMPVVTSAPGNFLTGGDAMIVHGEWFLWDLIRAETNVSYNVDFVPTPTGDQFTSWIGGWAWAIPSSARNPSGGARLLEFLGSREFAEAFITGAQAWAEEHDELLVLPGAF